MTAVMTFAHMLDKQALADQDFTIGFTTDTEEEHMLQIKNGIVLIYEDAPGKDAGASVTRPRNALFYRLQGRIAAWSAPAIRQNS